jgi:tetratricopeptide (TPR) repeat protein
MKPSPNNPEALWDAAAAAYNAADYLTAIEYYTTILDGGRHSAELYYNLANAYFKREQVGEALLNYNRALRLSPADEDIRHNLAFAEQSTKDSIEQIPEFFLSTWMRSVRNLMGGNAWTILSIVMLALALAMALLYLLAQPLTMRKTGFYSMALFGLLFIITTSFAWSARTEATAQRDAIIMSSAASIKSSPDSNSTELFVLHEGTKVRVGEVMDKWAEVRIADGRKGWIEIDRIERI